MHLINCEIELNLTWAKDCITSEISRTPQINADSDVNPSVQQQQQQLTMQHFKQKNTKLYVPVVTLPINNNITFLENVKQDLKRKDIDPKQ